MAHGSGVMSIKNTIRKKYTVSEWDLSEIIGNGGDKNMIKSQKTLQFEYKLALIINFMYRTYTQLDYSSNHITIIEDKIDEIKFYV